MSLVEALLLAWSVPPGYFDVWNHILQEDGFRGRLGIPSIFR